MSYNNIDYSKLSVVEKRRYTILKKKQRKQEKKKQYHFKREDKNILNAGNAYFNEKDKINDKFIINKIIERQREKKKFEKTIKAINNMYQIKTIEDENLNIIYYRDFKIYKGDNKRNLINDFNQKIFINDALTEAITPNYEYIKDRLRNIFINEVKNNSKNLKILQFFTIKYTTIDQGYYHKRYFNSDTSALTSLKIIEGILKKQMLKFQNDIESIDSGGPFSGIIKIDVKLAKTKNIIGGSFIELPPKIKAIKACVNIKNDDNKCFLWSLIASKHYKDIKKVEVRHYKKFIDSFKTPINCSFPVPIDEIPIWEEENNIKINLFTLDENENIKIEYNTHKKNKNVVNLLQFKDHYVWLKNLDRIDSKNTSNHTIYRCSYCLEFKAPTKEKLENHIKKCLSACCISPDEQLPNIGENIMKFKHFDREFKHPYHIIADFESTLETINEGTETNKKYQKHVANSYGLKYNCIHEEYNKPIEIFNSPNKDEVIENFILRLETLAKESYKLSKQNIKNIIMSDTQKEEHYNKKNCSRCNLKFNAENYKVKHHDHITGNFIATLCTQCNLLYDYKKFIPVYIHNLKGYDAHLFITGLFNYGYKELKGDNITCIPNNEERYISFSKNIIVDSYKKEDKIKNVLFEIRFIDTYGFMGLSVEELANNLKKDCKNINELRNIFKNVSNEFKDDEQFELLIKKGVYPYDYITSYDKLNEKRLPYRKDFYSKLNNKECSEKDYKTAIDVWLKFNCKSFLDYHNIYLKSDVLLLADIWENFRSVCFNNYNLDCEHYYTAPGLSFDSMLKITDQELELLTDIEIYKFVESGIRGGISQISKRHAIANNKYIDNYDKNKEDSYILYLDANNLYGYAMSKYLPVGDFKWNDEEFNEERILNLNDEGDKGYLLSVDLDIPNNLHDYFNDYPLCPESIKIKKDDLNEWQQKDYTESNIKKLCLTLYNKTNYIINYRYLKLVLSLGVKLKKVNKVLEYKQSNFLSKYINLNTELRKKSKNKFEKDFYKLMNNAVYGKTLENVRGRINFRLITTEEEALRVKNMKRFNIFNENLVGVHIIKNKVNLNKPIYLGQCILDDSKVLMADFHYNFMKKKIKKNNINLLFTDTDSLCYHIKNQDIFKIIKKNKNLFDLSNYDENHELYDIKNNKVIGKFTNESPNQILEFVGLRSKLYSFTAENDIEKHNKCKGIKRYIAENKINIDDYKKTLYTRKSKKVTQNGIRSYNHQLYTESQLKIALSCNDDKRFILNNNIDTYSFGHKKIKSKVLK